ncbi:MAG: hypothetical protein HRU25_12805 [Psychrobium sp.]|nr:hypothetical protein [Psychrobium sp.]
MNIKTRKIPNVTSSTHAAKTKDLSTKLLPNNHPARSYSLPLTKMRQEDEYCFELGYN